jgi:hypothetical protein
LRKPLEALLDPETIRTLAEALSQHLTPVLPYLVTLGDKAWEEVGKKLGGGAVEGVKKLWGRVLETPEAEKAAKKLAEGDLRRAGAFEAEIEDILTADTSLAETLARVLEAPGIRVVVQGERGGSDQRRCRRRAGWGGGRSGPLRRHLYRWEGRKGRRGIPPPNLPPPPDARSRLPRPKVDGPSWRVHHAPRGG